MQIYIFYYLNKISHCIQTKWCESMCCCYLQIHHGQLYQNVSLLQNVEYRNPRLQSIFDWNTQQRHTTDHGIELENKVGKIIHNEKEEIISTSAVQTTYMLKLKKNITNMGYSHWLFANGLAWASPLNHFKALSYSSCSLLSLGPWFPIK